MKTILAICTCFFCYVSMSAFAFQTDIAQGRSICESSLHAQKLSLLVADGLVQPDTVSESLFYELGRQSKSALDPLSPSVEEPRYLAIGGSLTAGVRNGGLYRFAQLTSYPNFIARQMALKDFTQPLFGRKELLIGLKNVHAKVILATVPDIRDFPYFHFVTPSMARQHNGGAALYAMINDDLFDKSKGSPQFLTEVKDTDLLLPTQNVEALFLSSESKRGISPQRPLESKDVLTEDELSVFDLNNSLNDFIRNLAAKFEYPAVDLHGIYKRILDGQFTTDDGVRIDPVLSQRQLLF